MSTRTSGIVLALFLPLLSFAQGGDQQLRAKADALYQERRFAEAMGMYSQLVSLTPGDRELNYRFGTCLLHGGEDKEKAIGHLKYATEDPAGPAAAWYWLGRAYHLNYRFKEAQVAYQRFRGTGDKKALADWPVEGFEQQCRNGEKLLSSLKDIRVRSKVEVTDSEFFRFYELGDIGGRIVVVPDELLTSLDKKNKQRGLVYLPDRGGPIYFSSLGKDGRTGRDIYRTELLPDGSFATPVKLAGYINTDLDEDYAFMHPDGRTFYFSSKGHNSMGGYDVFRTTYDKGLDAFGRPENLDFAVSTPDDDIFYMVDGEHKEACFASGRSSRQGMLHVYRVSTAQVPVVITILKGTYASVIDKEDRKARIIVEDALTREQVADVRTDINGNYVLSLPRTGRFRFLVECGPSGKTHAGMVEVPRADGPRAYRQELELTAQGDIEKLVIRNYFDVPLEGDIIELALEEIKRRARLDVSSGDDPVVQAPEEVPVTDVITAAGFTGDVDKAAAVRMAEEDAAELDRESLDLELRSKEALAIAVDALEEADHHTREAEAYIAQANAATLEEERNTRMVEAARSRQRAREAGMRARAAQRTAEDLGQEGLTTRQRAATASRIATDVRATIGAGKDQEALPHLIALKQQHDTRTGPDATPDAAERTRRAVTEQQQLAERAMRVAVSKREEESELTDRVNRLKRDRDATSNRSKQQEMQRGIDEGEAQLSALRDETRAAQAKASVLERETALLRGQATLTKHLTTSTISAAPDVPADQVATLPQRIIEAESKANALPIDERFDALLKEPVTAMEARMFNWDLVSAARGVPLAVRITQAAEREPAFDAERAASRTVAMDVEAADRGQVTGVTVAQVPASADRDALVPTTTTTDQEPATTTTTDLTDDAPKGDPDLAASGSSNAPVTQQRPTTTTTAADTQGGADGAAPTASGQGGNDDVIVRTDGATAQDGATDTRTGEQDTQGAQGGVERSGTQGAIADRGTEPGDTAKRTDNTRDGGQGVEDAGQGTVVSSDVEQGAGTEAMGLSDEAATQRFLLENERAELQQSLPTARDRADRDRIQARLTAIDAAVAELDRANAAARTDVEPTEAEEIAEVEVDRNRIPLVFTERTPEQVILDSLFTDHVAMRERLYRMPDADERAAGLNGLELMIADSIKEEMAVQLGVLELDPQQAPVVLPRVERLRQLREAHRAQAERHLAERKDEIAALAAANTTVDITGEDAPAQTPQEQLGDRRTGDDPINDRFVAVDVEQVYTSKLEHRATTVSEAVAMKEADLARMDGLSVRIDSLVDRMKGMARDKEYQRLEKQMDRLVDERYILSTELGQRTAFLVREEWSLGMDSLKGHTRVLASKGLPPDDPMLVMAQGMSADAERQFKSASETRKRADRSEDILTRDNLYKQAYQQELEALRELDRSLTVHAYLNSADHLRGESLAYEQVAAKVLGLETELLAQRNPPTSTTPSVGVEPVTPAPTVATTTQEPTEAVAARAVGEAQGERDDAAATPTTTAATVGQVAPVTSTTGEGVGEPAGVSATRTNEPPVAQAPATTTSASTGTPSVDSDAMLRQAEARLRPEDRVPVGRYEQYLGNEPTTLTQTDSATVDGLELLNERLTKAAGEQEALTQVAAEREDRATALQNSAVDAKRKDREKLEAMAVLERSAADSLRREAELRGAEVIRLEADRDAAARLTDQRQRVLKFYYLSAEEQSIVLNDNDASRYFQARARAMQQAEAADEAATAARSNREVAAIVRSGATEARRTAGNDPDEATLDQISRLELRAGELLARADSLDRVSEKLRNASDVNVQQASVMLQGMDAVRSTELQALEMRTRRTDAVLAAVRGEAGPTPTTRAADPRSEQPAAAATAPPPTIQAQGSGVTPSTEGIATTAPTTATIPPSEGTAAAVPASGSVPPVAVEVARAAVEQPGVSDANTSATPTTATIDPDMITFRMPDELVTDIFELRPEGVRNEAPILMDQPLPEGIVFKVQIGAFRKAVPEEAFSDMTPVMGETVNPGLVRYTAGLFTGFQQAAQAKDKVRSRGYSDAFVVAYRNGERIPLGEAMRQASEASAATRAITTTTTGSTTPAGTSTQPVATIPAPRQEPSAPVVITAPTTAPPSTDPAVILARYPATAEEVLATFTATPEAAAYYNVPGAAPARQVETIKGLFFTVQVGVYSRPVPLDKLFNITPLNSERTETAKVRYTTGIYTDMAPARSRRDEAVTLGVKDAFITAYLNGKRIPMREADALIAKFGPAIMARP